MSGKALRDVTRYNPVCLIGNWSEDRELQRSMLRELLGNKARGTLKVDRYHKKMEIALGEVELTCIAADGFVHFGDVVQLVHVDTGCVLSGDVSDKDNRPGEDACSATAAPEIRAPCHRNSFTLVKYRAPRTAVFEPQYNDDTLHYGQKFRLALHPGASSPSMDTSGDPRPLHLFSKPVSTTHFARMSRSQLVGLTWRPDTIDTVWQIVTPDPQMRGASEGVEVMAGAPVLIRHAATQRPLCLEPNKYPNDFGMELEVSARQATLQGLKLALEQTAMGISKGFLPKSQLSDNHWTFVTGSVVAPLPEKRFDVGAVAAVLARLALDLAAENSAAVLERKMVLLETSDSRLAIDELPMIFAQVGSALSTEEAALLAAQFPADRAGFINALELRRALRLPKTF